MTFPFGAVVISFPDQRAADSANEPLQDLRATYASTTILATTDPFAARVGSGGGSLAALECVDDDSHSVLILHAGGESSRSPSQMVLGKAWTTLACRKGLLTPLHVWLEQCVVLFRHLPTGSTVVVASDTLLQLPLTLEMDWSSVTEAVVGLAVPAPLATASRHGVFDVGTVDTAMSRVPCRGVWQKPSVETLRQLVTGDMAWIDTGVVVFLPSATVVLRRLAAGPLRRCTRRGLETYADEERVAQALKIDLYTHMLQALSLPSAPQTLQEYIQRQGDLNANVAEALYTALSVFTLNVLCIREGRFLHLGTTRELMDFAVIGSQDSKVAPDDSSLHSLSREFGRYLGLVRRHAALTFGLEVEPSAVVMNSWLVAQQASTIGAAAVVEHCEVTTIGTMEIGAGSLVSGLRCQTTFDHLRIPPRTLVQQVALAAKAEQSVWMVLGVDDAIKETTTLYGQPLDKWLDWANVSSDDIWGEQTTRTLWTAKLHPVVSGEESFHIVFGWLNDFAAGLPLQNGNLDRWKTRRRLSLAEIRDGSDATIEFAHRRSLGAKIVEQRTAYLNERVKGILLSQELAMIDLRFARDAYCTGSDTSLALVALGALDDAFRKAWAKEMFAVCGRSCMVASAFLDDLARGGHESVAHVQALIEDDALSNLATSLLAPPTTNGRCPNGFDDFARARNAAVDGRRYANLLQLSEIMESVAQAMTRRCVCFPLGLVNSIRSAQAPPVYEQWVLAASPVRIDLAGGWTDTPPICYEYGSAVTGVAVLVDGEKPLSCRCRIVPRAHGIRIRTESRQSKTGNLLYSIDAAVGCLKDLADYCDPTSDCALVKCVLVYLGLVSVDALCKSTDDLQPLLNRFCQTEATVGLEIITTSLLPQGSGLGTSSILCGCVLDSIARCVGLDLSSPTNGNLLEGINDAVLKVEQLLTTGGGFQDQVNGLLGGAKTVRCERLHLPLQLQVERLSLDKAVEAHLNDKLVLVFTGQMRLAKNILQNVLRRWSRMDPDIVQTVDSLAYWAEQARNALQAGELDALGECLSAYWRDKKTMAGPESGVEPLLVEKVLTQLRLSGGVRGASLCGAGGGGFMVVLMRDHMTADELRRRLALSLPDEPALADMTWHDCQISSEGLTTMILPDNPPSEGFDPSWHGSDSTSCA